MRYGSLCSGIEAATVAWHPLGWQPAFFAEIEKFPSQVLAHHYPDVPNLGDITKFMEWPDAAIDVLVGGTPCQAFSVAGLRAGLDDPRGDLSLTYAAIARRYRPRWLAWENVPGVLSLDGGRAFASILGLLSGRRVEVPAGGWETAGVIPSHGRAYGLAWRVLDAQYIRVDGFERAVPQRRRRVFVVGYSGDWRRAAAVLFERHSLSGHPAPRRKTRQEIARPIAAGSRSTGGDRQPGVSADTADTMLVAHSLRGEGFDASEDGTGRGTPLVPIAFNAREDTDVSGDKAGPLGSSLPQAQAIAFDATQITSPHNYSNPKSGDPCHPLSAEARAPTVAFDMRGREGGAQFEGPHDTANIRAASGGSSRRYVAEQWAVRRLTPLECERLQGFPDGYTKLTTADGPRYKALGNSMAVNVMRWIGWRIELVDELMKDNAA